jgi:hypothetical protein
MTKARDLADGASALSAVSATELGYLDGVTSAVQTQLNAKQAVVSGVDSTELGYLDGVTSAVQTQLDAKTAKSTLTTTGDIYYASSANTPARLGIGSTGNVLTVASGIPSWAAPAGGGKVLQVVQGTTTTGITSTTTTYADTNLTASITPSSASSKVLVLITQSFSMYASSTDEVMAKVKLLRGATDILSYTGDFLKLRGANGTLTLAGIFPITYLDSPATTSSTTYKTQGAVNATGASRQITFNNFSSQIILMEIGA